ncbi:MAG: carbohydrate deacetylase [Endozoicomonas sp.]
MKLIVNADDFGLTRGVNLGIIEAFQQGIVRSTTLMMGMPAVEHAAHLALQNPSLKIGVHLRLTTGRPMADNVGSLLAADALMAADALLAADALMDKDKTGTSKQGQLQPQSQFWDNQSMNPDHIEKELRAQIEHFLKLGIPLSHLDGHHHCHRHPQVATIATRLAAEYQVPLRPTQESTLYRNTTLGFSDGFYGDDLTTEAFLSIVKQQLSHAQVLEMMTHPALVDEPLLKASGYAIPRTRELAILTDPSLSQALSDMDVSITDYSCLQEI